jgi:hypothetical protein
MVETVMRGAQALRRRCSLLFFSSTSDVLSVSTSRSYKGRGKNHFLWCGGVRVQRTSSKMSIDIVTKGEGAVQREMASKGTQPPPTPYSGPAAGAPPQHPTCRNNSKII